ncbi:hypothetical protein D1872_282310 [compost metagenome]|nr:hypothetical protein PAECIP111890_00301 [Paenibacillus sp. JJ-223]
MYTSHEDMINVIFVAQKNEQLEEALLNNTQLTALLNAKQVWIEKFNNNFKIENLIWTYTSNHVSLHIYLK